MPGIVQKIRPLSQDEMEENLWFSSTDVLVFEDSSFVYPTTDVEGNGPGNLFIMFRKTGIYVPFEKEKNKIIGKNLQPCPLRAHEIKRIGWNRSQGEQAIAFCSEEIAVFCACDDEQSAPGVWFGVVDGKPVVYGTLP